MTVLRGLLALTTCCIVTVGCQSKSSVSNDAIIHNLSPELQGTVERPVDINRHINQTADINSRLFWDDMGRAFYTTAPSALSPMPVSGGSGNPR